VFECGALNLIFNLAIPQGAFQGHELPLLEGLGELREIRPGIGDSRIRNRQPYTHGARCHVYLRQEFFDLARECTAWIGIDGNLR
jgi:hypothetical protein